MGLMKQAYDTYCAMEKQYAGVYDANIKEPLIPVSHQITNADLEITLDSEGNLLDARTVEKEDAATIIPVTELSSGRTGDTSCAHPLCDQIRFLSPMYPAKYEAYLTQLHRWEQSPYAHPKLSAIARYVEKGRILEDMARLGLITLNENGLPIKKKQKKQEKEEKEQKEDKLIVRWRVETGKEGEISACWQDQSLFRAFIDYYASTKKEDSVFCMVSGKLAPPASQHPKKIINICANAKLVSANDTSGFTYRGRFKSDAEAMTMSYEASQKSHNALHWLAATQGVAIGGRTFLCWNPHGVDLPSVQAAFLRKGTPKQVKYSDYRKALSETLRGWKETIPADAGAVIAAFDAATSGRLALTYYSELPASDFLERLTTGMPSAAGTTTPSAFRHRLYIRLRTAPLALCVPPATRQSWKPMIGFSVSRCSGSCPAGWIREKCLRTLPGRQRSRHPTCKLWTPSCERPYCPPPVRCFGNTTTIGIGRNGTCHWNRKRKTSAISTGGFWRYLKKSSGTPTIRTSSGSQTLSGCNPFLRSVRGMPAVFFGNS